MKDEEALFKRTVDQVRMLYYAESASGFTTLLDQLQELHPAFYMYFYDTWVRENNERAKLWAKCFTSQPEFRPDHVSEEGVREALNAVDTNNIAEGRNSADRKLFKKFHRKVGIYVQCLELRKSQKGNSKVIESFSNCLQLFAIVCNCLQRILFVVVLFLGIYAEYLRELAEAGGSIALVTHNQQEFVHSRRANNTM
jgi:hypothetical protein